MSGSVNRAILVGNLGRDPEGRSTQAGDRVVTLNVATAERWKDRSSGERKERTEWHRVVIFNPALTEVAEKYTRKGSKVYVEGQLQTRKWTDNGGVERYSTEIVLQRFGGTLVLLDKAERDPGRDDYSGHQHDGRWSSGAPGGAAGGSPTGGAPPDGGFPLDLDDDVPF